MDPKNLPKQLNFRRELAWQMIEHYHVHLEAPEDEGASAWDTYKVHEHCAGFHNAWYHNDRLWVLGAKDKYQQYK